MVNSLYVCKYFNFPCVLISHQISESAVSLFLLLFPPLTTGGSLWSVRFIHTNTGASYRCLLLQVSQGEDTNTIHLQTCCENLWTLVPVVNRLSAVGNHGWILLWRLRKFNRTGPKSHR